MILLLDHSSQACQSLHQIYPSLAEEDVEDQTFACFVVGNDGDQAFGNAVVRNVVETVVLASFHAVDEVAAFEVALVHWDVAIDAASNLG